VVPGDKSISHRALILAALARGRSVIARPNLGDDVAATATMLSALGSDCALDRSKVRALVESKGRASLREPQGVLDAGNSGTSIRLLVGVCAGIDALSVLSGDPSLRRRPMLRVVAPLRQMGARIDGRAHGDLAPLVVRGGGLTGIDLDLPLASAQVKSAVLLAGLFAQGTTTVSESGASRDHTERMLSALGAELERTGRGVSVVGGTELDAFELVVPGDLSSAMFLIAAAALAPGSDLTLVDVGLNPTRVAALEVLRSMGADIELEYETEALGEPVGHIRVRYAPLHGVDVPADAVPGLIDEIPALAVVASGAEGTTAFTGVGELRVKESDRIAALASGFETLGSPLDVSRDGFTVTGPVRLTGGEVDSFGDHRIALAFAVAGSVATERVRIRGWSSVNTSFPEFLDLLGDATRKR